MIIANPLYDTAFKGLIKDHDVAKALISTLLETEVLEVHPFVTEYIMPMEENDERPRCVRLDYTATIKDKNGKTQNVLIEVQKASGADLVSRFRQYLAVAGYMRKPEIEPETKEKKHLPIITIYFLGFKLNNIPTPCLKVSRQYVDMLQNKVLQTKEKFVELLTHDSVVIQTPRINTDGEPKTELEKLLSIFEQKNFLDENQSTLNYNYSFNSDFRKKMIDVLHYISSDPEERKKLDGEAYWHKIFEDTTGELLKRQEELKEAQMELKGTKDELKGTKDELKGAQEKLKGTEGELKGAQEKVSALENKNKEIVQKMKLKGMSAEEISDLTGLPIDEIISL